MCAAWLRGFWLRKHFRGSPRSWGAGSTCRAAWCRPARRRRASQTPSSCGACPALRLRPCCTLLLLRFCVVVRSRAAAQLFSLRARAGRARAWRSAGDQPRRHASMHHRLVRSAYAVCAAQAQAASSRRCGPRGLCWWWSTRRSWTTTSRRETRAALFASCVSLRLPQALRRAPPAVPTSGAGGGAGAARPPGVLRAGRAGGRAGGAAPASAGALPAGRSGAHRARNRRALRRVMTMPPSRVVTA